MPRFRSVVSAPVIPKEVKPVLTGKELHDVMTGNVQNIITLLNTIVYDKVIKIINIAPAELETIIKSSKTTINGTILMSTILNDAYDVCMTEINGKSHMIYDYYNAHQDVKSNKPNVTFDINEVVNLKLIPDILDKSLLIKQLYASQRDLVIKIINTNLIPYWQTCMTNSQKLVGVVHIWNVLKIVKKVLNTLLSSINNKYDGYNVSHNLKIWTIKYVVYELFYAVLFPLLKTIQEPILNEFDKIRTIGLDDFNKYITFSFELYATKIFTKYYSRIHRSKNEPAWLKVDTVYNEFETEYLHRVQDYYKLKLMEWNSTLNVTEYVNHVIRAHSIERQLISNLLKDRDSIDLNWKSMADKFISGIYPDATVPASHPNLFEMGRKRDGKISQSVLRIKNYICNRRDNYSEWILALNAFSNEFSVSIEHVYKHIKQPENTYIRYRKETDKLFVVDNQEFLYNHETSGLKSMFDREDKISIRKIQHICVYLPDSVRIIADCYQQYLTTKLMAVINGLSVGDALVIPDYIRNLITLNAKSEDFMISVFDGGIEYKKVHTATFNKCISMTVEGSKYSNAELFATYIDQLLQNAKGYIVTDEEKLSDIVNIINLSKFLRDKDIFCESYRILLAKRLVNQKITSFDHEKHVIVNMKIAIGVSFVVKMEAMIKDYLCESPVEQPNFIKYIDVVKHLPKLDFNVQILTDSAWPTFPDFPMKLGSIAPYFESFVELFRMKQDKKILRFVPSNGTVTITAAFSGRKYELVLIPPQAVIIELFNYKTSYTIEDICSITIIPMKIVCGMIDSFIRIGLLNKNNTEKGFKPEDIISLNEKFTSKTIKTIVRAPNISESKTIVASDDIDKQRGFTLDASIVRIMKARKTLNHNQLVEEVLRQITIFVPTVKQIKACIEKLIEREYIERTDEENVYNYLA